MDETEDPYMFNPATAEDLGELLETTTRLLDECGISFCLAFGTLLGAVREKFFLKGDDDVDIIVTDEDKLYASLPFFYEHGLFINRIYKTELYTFHMKERKGNVDLYILHPIKDWIYKDWCVSIRGHYAPKRFFVVIEKDGCQIGHKSLPCPQHPEALLEWWYGKSWRIPRSGKAVEDVFLRRLAQFPGKYWRKGRRWLKKKFGKA